MSGTTTPTGPVARDPLNPNIVIPVYVGGDGPVPTPEPGDRGDSIAPASVPAAAQPTTAASTPAAVVAPAIDPAADPDAKPDEGSEPSDPATPPVEKPARNDKGQFIPRSRFNEVNEERKRLQAKVDELEGKTAPSGEPAAPSEAAYDFDTKEAEYINLVLDGKTAEAAALRKEIRAAERTEYEKVAQQATVQTTQQMSVKDRIEQISDRYASEHPVFDPESDDYNDELLDDVRTLYAGAMQTGAYGDPALAFEESIKKAMRLHGIEAAAPAASVAPAAAATSTTSARTAQKRVEAIVNQPPSLSGVGTTGAPETHATIDIKTLSDRDFAALPEATRRRLRGDTA